jgi:hypothetical protein
MQTITAPLKPGDSGPAVANLQDALQILIGSKGVRSQLLTKERGVKGSEE